MVVVCIGECPRETFSVIAQGDGNSISRAIVKGEDIAGYLPFAWKRRTTDGGDSIRIGRKSVIFIGGVRTTLDVSTVSMPGSVERARFLGWLNGCRGSWR